MTSTCKKNLTFVSVLGQELRDPQMYHPRLLIVPQQQAITHTPKPNAVSIAPSANNNSTEKQTLSSILGFDFEDNIEKSDIPVQRDVDVANAEKSAAASMTSQINSILQSVSTSPSSSTLLTSPIQTQQRPQLNQNLMQQRQSILNQVEQQQQTNKLTAQSPQQVRNSQAIVTNASIQQQITAINQQHQYNQQQKLLAGNSGTTQLNRSISEIATSTVASNVTVSGQEYLRQQSTQSHQILTQAQSNKSQVQNVQVMQQVGPTGQSQNAQQTVQIQQQLTNQNQPQQQQQIIISQNNQTMTQKHIINTSTAQPQIQQARLEKNFFFIFLFHFETSGKKYLISVFKNSFFFQAKSDNVTTTTSTNGSKCKYLSESTVTTVGANNWGQPTETTNSIHSYRRWATTG